LSRRSTAESIESIENAEAKKNMEINDITEMIIGCAIRVHKKLGPGFLESVYQVALAYELSKEKIHFEREKVLPVKYEDIILEIGFRCDFYIENSIIVECKAVKEILPIHQAQLLNYLKISEIKVGLLINFNKLKLTDGLKRIVHNYEK